MQLPGRLRLTTLGDLLGGLHRASATGTLALAEDRGRIHRVHVSAGLVVAVEVDGSGASLADVLRRDGAIDEDTLRRSVLRSVASRRLLGEVLVTDFRLSPSVIGAALRRQLLGRLQFLEQLVDARILFHVAVRTPRGALTDLPLGPTEFLRGRRRARDRATGNTPWPAAAPETRDPKRAKAWQILGIPPNTDPLEIKRAYRRLARAYHPDLHPGVSNEERRTLEERFAALTSAYQTLVA